MSKAKLLLEDAQRMRDRCNLIFLGQDIRSVGAALGMLTSDVVLKMTSDPSLAERGADAIAADVRNIIRERIAARGARQ